MAAGNKVVGNGTITASGGTYDIQPAAGAEWTIHNITITGTSGQYTIADAWGSPTVTTNAWDSAVSTPYAYLGIYKNVTNGQWIRITNNTANTLTISYDGVQTA